MIARMYLVGTMCIAFLGCVFTLLAFAQGVADTTVAFEVASVKPNPNTLGSELWSFRGSRFTARNVTLRALVRAAFGKQEQTLTNYQLVNGPKWIDIEKFDIEATTPDGRDSTRGSFPSQVLAMLRRLLEERFALRTHFEQKELGVFALVLARRDGELGPRLHRRNSECSRSAPSDLKMPIFPQATEHRTCGGRVGPGVLTATGATMTNIVSGLAQLVPGVDRVVVDRTGLTGTFDVDLSWTPENELSGDASGVVSNSNASSLFTALGEQLGLKLESSKEIVDVLFIDAVDRPTPD